MEKMVVRRDCAAGGLVGCVQRQRRRPPQRHVPLPSVGMAHVEEEAVVGTVDVALLILLLMRRWSAMSQSISSQQTSVQQQLTRLLLVRPCQLASSHSW